MEPGQIASAILVSLIAAIAGWLTTRASNKASTTNVTTSSRVEMEKEAYERARKLDTDTIKRQDEEIDEVRNENKQLKESMELVQQQNRQLNEDMTRIAKDNYQVHRENQQVLEANAQMMAENRRLREQGERVIRDNHVLHAEVESLRQRVTKLQRGIPAESAMPVRERETDTNPMGDYRDRRE